MAAPGKVVDVVSLLPTGSGINLTRPLPRYRYATRRRSVVLAPPFPHFLMMPQPGSLAPPETPMAPEEAFTVNAAGSRDWSAGYGDTGHWVIRRRTVSEKTAGSQLSSRHLWPILAVPVIEVGVFECCLV